MHFLHLVPTFTHTEPKSKTSSLCKTGVRDGSEALNHSELLSS